MDTPSFDRFARSGVKFENAYCQFPYCNPSRISFLTARRPDTTRVFSNSVNFRSVAAMRNAITLPQHFKNLGYHSAHVGKTFHEAFDDTRSWSQIISSSGGASQSEILTTDRSGIRNYRVPSDAAGVAWGPVNRTDAGMRDGDIARKAANYLRNHTSGNFFLGAGFRKPHQDWIAPSKYFNLYPPEQASRFLPLMVPPSATVTAS